MGLVWVCSFLFLFLVLLINCVYSRHIHFALFLHLILYYFLSASSIFRLTWISVCRIYSKRSQLKKKTVFLSIAKWCSSKNLQKTGMPVSRGFFMLLPNNMLATPGNAELFSLPWALCALSLLGLHGLCPLSWLITPFTWLLSNYSFSP